MSCNLSFSGIFGQSIHARRNVEKPTTKAIVLSSATCQEIDDTPNSKNAQEQCNKSPSQYSTHTPKVRPHIIESDIPAEETRPNSLRWPTSRVPSPSDQQVPTKHADQATYSPRDEVTQLSLSPNYPSHPLHCSDQMAHNTVHHHD